MMTRLFTLGLVLPIALLFGNASVAMSKEEIKTLLEQRLPDLEIVRVRDGTIEGLYEVDLQGVQTLMVTEDGRHVISGDIFEITSLGPVINVSELKRDERMNELNGYRKEILSEFDESKMVVFSPGEGRAKKTITVFTDTTCGFCRKLHRDVPELNRLGIAVRYMAFPRGGTLSKGYREMVSAWCAEDPAKALTLAKLGKSIDPATCDDPVEEEYELGKEFGINATPALVLEDGTLIMGYRNAKTLAEAVGVPYRDS